jgi:hypothetical protein
VLAVTQAQRQVALMSNGQIRELASRYNCERKHQSLDYQTPEKLFKKIV